MGNPGSVAAAAATAAWARAVGAAKAPVAATTTVAAAARRARFHRAGFIDHHAAAAQGLAVHSGDRSLGLRIAAHLDKSEALGASRVAVFYNLVEAS